MVERIKPLRQALENLAKSVRESTSSEQTIQEQHGWQFPPLSRHDIARMATVLNGKLGKLVEADINKEFSVQPYLDRIERVRTETLQHLWNGNGNSAYQVYRDLLETIDWAFWPVYPVAPDWEKANAEGKLPKDIAAQLRSQKASLARTGIDIEGLKEKLKYIEQAHEAAVALPTDLESLKEAQSAVQEAGDSVKRHEVAAETSRNATDALMDEITALRDEATKLVENTEDAYSAATTRGLGEAFQKRGDRLAMSMWAWVIGLVIALGMGAYLGSARIHELQSAINVGRPNTSVWLNTILALFSIAAPVWFAWIATKQIGHRFRLSEDYAFKASVAKAYEGYRREAARLDPAFANKLFGSALNRLDEAPIRFVEHETYGSPWHEVLKMRFARGRSEPPAETGDDLTG